MNNKTVQYTHSDLVIRATKSIQRTTAMTRKVVKVTETLYETLGVEATSDKTTIKKAYRSKAKTHHPDKGGNPKEFHAITVAYKVLSDDKQRKEYNETGKIPADSTETLYQTAREEVIRLFLDSLQVEAGECLAVHHKTIYERNHFEHVLRELNKTIHSTERELEQQRMLHEYTKGVSERISTAKADNVLVSILENELRALDMRKDELTHKLEIFNKAIEIVKDYEYKVDAPRPLSRWATMNTF